MKKAMKIKQLIYVISFLICWSFLTIGCESEENLKKQGDDFVEVPLEFSLKSGGLLGKDTFKVNPRPIFVDRVKVYVYQRPLRKKYKTDLDGFQKTGEVKLVAHEMNSDGIVQPRFKAFGKVPVKRGFEYRMTAVAYSEQLKEDALFGVENPFFADAEVVLKDAKEYTTPELFFGNVVYQDKDTIFRFENGIDEMKSLSGWLYRGVAGVELMLQHVAKEAKKIELLADSIYPRVKARVYDDFHTGYDMQKDGTSGHFVLDSWNRAVDKVESDGSIKLVGANLFEICTSLSLRITLAGEGGTDKQTVCRLRVVKKNKPEASKQLYALPGDGGNGTGIIPGGEQTPEEPEKPETERNPYQICFKRNNYYRLTGDYEKLLSRDYAIQVVVNPNWDGDIYLPLDRTEGNKQ